MLIALAFDVLVAWLLARKLTVWWAWAPAALAGGIAVSFLYALALSGLGFVSPSEAGFMAVRNSGIHALACVIVAWGFVSKRRSQ